MLLLDLPQEHDDLSPASLSSLKHCKKVQLHWVLICWLFVVAGRRIPNFFLFARLLLSASAPASWSHRLGLQLRDA